MKRTWVLHSAHGFSLPELLVSLLLCVITAGICTSAYLAGSKHLVRQTSRFGIFNQLNYAESFLRRQLSLAHRLYGLQASRVHTSAAIRFADGKLLDWKSKAPALRPKPGSDALSLLLLRPELMLQANDSLLCLPSTPSAEEKTFLSDNEHWLGLGLDFALELEGTLKKQPNQPTLCAGALYRATLHRAASPMFYHSALDESFALSRIRTLIPIGESFSLYQANDSTLRYLGHLSSANSTLIFHLESFQATTDRPSFLLKLQLAVSDGKQNLRREIHFPLLPIHPSIMDLVL